MFAVIGRRPKALIGAAAAYAAGRHFNARTHEDRGRQNGLRTRLTYDELQERCRVQDLPWWIVAGCVRLFSALQAGGRRFDRGMLNREPAALGGFRVSWATVPRLKPLCRSVLDHTKEEVT